MDKLATLPREFLAPTLQMKKIAALTMVRHDYFFLQKWVEYYSAMFGSENLYVYFDGTDQVIPEFCSGINATLVEKIGSTVQSSDRGRINFISEKAKELFDRGYELVVGGDADEYLVVDPAENKTLAQFLGDYDIRVSLSGLGLDFGQKPGVEPDLVLEKPFLEQRRYAQIGTRYTKASVIAKACNWGSGFHRVRGENFHIARGLYLMHFGYSDIKIIEQRLSNSDRLSQGWERHMKKRSRTIRLVKRLKARNFDRWCRIARILETSVRKPYAWNKPGLLGMKIIVALPERFKKVL